MWNCYQYYVVSLNENLFSITAKAYIVPLKQRVVCKVLY